MSFPVSRKAREIPTAWKVAVLLVVNASASIIIPLLIDHFNKDLFTLTDGIILGFLIIITLTLSELLFLVQHVYDTEIQQTTLWKHRNEIDITLGRIRSDIHLLIQSEGADSFYFEHYRSEIQWLEERLEDTIARKEIILDRYHIDATRVLLSIFDDPKHNIFRATHLLWETGDEFDVTYQIYFNAWLEKMRKNSVGEIRRVFIYHDLDDFNHKNVIKLLAFHKSTKLPLHSKIVSRSELRRFKADFNITDGVEDFGIFSDLYLYLGSSRDKEQIAGVFSKDDTKIKRYISCFDALWNSPAAQTLTRFTMDIRGDINENELFDPSYQIPVDVERTLAGVDMGGNDGA